MDDPIISFEQWGDRRKYWPSEGEANALAQSKAYRDETMIAFGSIVRNLPRNPLLQQYIQKVERARRDEETRIITAEDVFGERLGWILAVAKQMVDGQMTDTTGMLHASAIEFVMIANLGVPFLISSEVHDVCREMEVPPHIVSKDFLPYPLIYMTFEVDDCLVDEVDGSSVMAYVLKHVPERGCVLTSVLHCRKTGRIQLKAGTIMYGKEWQPRTGDAGERELFTFFSMVNSPHIGVTKNRLLRTTRRRLKHSRSEPVEGRDCVYMLRLKPDEGTRRFGENSGQRDWKHRWAVRGHVRNQWYSKARENRLIWIAPYLKGPDDKPFKQKVYAK